MTEEREVAITGLGAVTSFGRDVTAFWEALVAGRSAIAPITAFDASAYPCSIAGEVRNYAPHSQLSAEQAARLDRGALFAVDAAIQALAPPEPCRNTMGAPAPPRSTSMAQPLTSIISDP